MYKSLIFNKDILSADQFTKDNLKQIIEVAHKMRRVVEKQKYSQVLKGKVMTALFYEPSSRTYGSFISAMQHLGGGFIPIQGVTYSSVSKGETLTDTIRTFASFSDIIVLRHPEIGSAKIAAEFSPKPIINAGDGVGEHPSQALLDFYTITDHFSQVSNITVTFVGDLLNGRTVHSLARVLSLFPKIKINLVSPQILKFPPELLEKLKQRGVIFYETEKLEKVIAKCDVLYITRVQKERFSDLDTYEKIKHYYILSADKVSLMKRKSIIMHPFPRVGEILADVDLDPRSVYLTEQMRNGMYVRMAILALVLNKTVRI